MVRINNPHIRRLDLVFKRKERKLEDGVVLPMVSRQDLIFIKESAANDPERREKELKDIECLKSK